MNYYDGYQLPNMYPIQNVNVGPYESAILNQRLAKAKLYLENKHGIRQEVRSQQAQPCSETVPSGGSVEQECPSQTGAASRDRHQFRFAHTEGLPGSGH